MTAGLPRVGELVVQGDGVCGRAESPPRGAVLGGGAGFSALTIMASFLLLLCAPHFPARHRAFAPATLPKTSPPSRNLVRIRPRSLRFRHQFLTEPPDQVSAPPQGTPHISPVNTCHPSNDLPTTQLSGGGDPVQGQNYICLACCRLTSVWHAPGWLRTCTR